MAEFCSCGSLKIEGNCTNKNCANKIALKPGASKSRSKGTSAASKALKPKPEATQARSRRSSKCITYNLYEIKSDKENMDEDNMEEENMEEENQ